MTAWKLKLCYATVAEAKMWVLFCRAIRQLDTSCFDREPRALVTGLSPRVFSMGGVAEFSAASLACWRLTPEDYASYLWFVTHRSSLARFTCRTLGISLWRPLHSNHAALSFSHRAIRIFDFSCVVISTTALYWPTLRDVHLRQTYTGFFVFWFFCAS